MKELNLNKKSHKRNLKRFLPLFTLLLIAIIFSVLVSRSGEPLSVKTILRYTPENTVLASIILLLFFGLKSFTVVFPLSILYLSSGILFPPFPAVLISTVGLSITITIPYWIGRYSGEELVRSICAKHPKASQIAYYQNKNIFFACFITRIVGFLPGDIVSMYFGACQTNFRQYLTAGICGSMLSIVTTTLLGAELSNPFSVTFFIVLCFRIFVSAGSILINYFLNKKRKE